MKHITFYEEFKDKRKHRRVTAGNCVAVIKDNRWISHRPNEQRNLMFECVAGVFDCPNSECCTTAISDRVLRASYRRCSQTRAALVHPNLIEYLKD